MNELYLSLFVLSLVLPQVCSYNILNLGRSVGLRGALDKTIRNAASFAAAAPLVFSSFTAPVNAATGTNTPVYFGVGCFWHVQHEFVQTEKKILGRSDAEITSVAGYAGSTRTAKDVNNPLDKEGLVCYHNLLGKGDYGSLGYGEAVQISLPIASGSSSSTSSSSATDKDKDIFKAFADEYVSLFDSNGDRPDKGDRGPEYRSLVGLPGGVNSQYFPLLESAAQNKGLRLVVGRGETDSDTLGKKLVWVMDSESFPFRQAELYHQFHDGFFPGEQYPQAYNDMVKGAFERGLIKRTGCPDI